MKPVKGTEEYEKQRRRANEYMKTYRENNREKVLAYQRQWRADNRELCRAYVRKYDSEHRTQRSEKARRYRKENPDRYLNTIRKYRKKNPLPHREASRRYSDKNHSSIRDRRLRSEYGISLAIYNEMLAAQNGRCAICKGTQKKARSLLVDHDHVTGEVRGLLCETCNWGLGSFRDNIEFLTIAIAYLRRQKKRGKKKK